MGPSEVDDKVCGDRLFVFFGFIRVSNHACVLHACPCAPHQVAKQASIVCTIAAMSAMNYIPTIMFASVGPSEDFRYAVLVEIVFLVVGIGAQLATFLVLLKWVLAGRSGLNAAGIHARSKHWVRTVGVLQ